MNTFRTLALLGAIAVVPLASPGCTRADDAEAVADGADTPEWTYERYTVRGEIRTLPDERSALQVFHEAIPEFRNPDGTRGMNVMTMPFWPPLGIDVEDIEAARIEGFSHEGFEVGDRVRITFEVASDAETGAFVGYYATAMERLPEGEELDFTPLER